jgi:hypothetical protein
MTISGGLGLQYFLESLTPRVDHTAKSALSVTNCLQILAQGNTLLAVCECKKTLLNSSTGPYSYASASIFLFNNLGMGENQQQKKITTVYNWESSWFTLPGGPQNSGHKRMF